MSQVSDEDIIIAIFRKMLRHKWIGGSHTALDNIPKGFPNDVRPRVKRIVNKLIKEGYLVPKKTHYGDQVSLNRHMIKRISERIAADSTI